MKRSVKPLTVLFAVIMTACLILAGCGGSQTAVENAASASDGAAAEQNVQEQDTVPAGNNGNAVSGDYYLDLTDLGMKLTIYLRLSDDGTFIFSNTPAFEVNKSSGTWQQSGDSYVMVFMSVNGEDKSISDGLTSSFTVTEDGKLDFTSCERVYYGSASATTTSENNPDAKLIGVVIPDDYEAPSDESDFNEGTYISDDGNCTASFFEDGSYIIICKNDDSYLFEGGSYGVSTTQLALEPEGGNRISNEVLSDTELKVSVPVQGEERTEKIFTKTDDTQVMASFNGEGTVTGSTDTFDAHLTVYSNGVFEAEANGFTESGLILLNYEEGYFKVYPDHPEQGIRGLKQVTSVPNGTLETDQDGKLKLSDFRVRTSEGLSRDKCQFTEE